MQTNKSYSLGHKKYKIRDFATLIGLILMCVILSFLSPVFLTFGNINNIMAQSSVNACIAIGMTMVIISGGIDLSVGSILALSGVVMAKSLKAGMPIILSLLIGLIVGILCGIMNGIFVTKGNLPPFIATLGMMSMARGLTLLITDGRQISSFDNSFRFFGNGKVFMIPTQTIITLFFFILFHLIMKYTQVGRYCYAIGGNEEATRLSGINITKYKLIIYAISGFMSAVSAIILTARLNSAQPIAGMGYEMDAIAATVIGGASLAGGEGKILGTLIGALIIGVLRNGLNILNVSSYIQQIVIGAVIVIAVLFDKYRSK
jgi:ribose transport system permease protein